MEWKDLQLDFSDLNHYTYWNILSSNPLIVYFWDEHISLLVYLHRKFRGRRALFLKRNPWIETSEKNFLKYQEYYKTAQQYYPEHQVIFLSNTQENSNWFSRYNLPSVYCHQNGLLDEKIFKINTKKKEFNAIYLAQMRVFKRIELAVAIDSLSIISYNTDLFPDYFEMVRNNLKNAHWCNFDSIGERLLSAQEVCCEMNRSRVGLILSPYEGGNYATTEYLLCGLPVVSTESIGGRHVFFEPEFTRIVEPDPQAIADAVHELIKLDIDPKFIREKTLEKVLKHRKIFMDVLQKYCEEEEITRDIRRDWSKLFFNKLLRWEPIKLFDKRLNELAT